MIDKNNFDGSLQTKGEFFKNANFEAVYDQINSAILKYIDPEKKVLLKEFGEERVCLVCDSSNRRNLFIKGGFQHVCCADCGFIYVNPILKEELLIEYYSQVSGSWADITAKEAYTTFQNLYYQFHLENILKHIKVPERSILDIGCNNGEFLSAAKSKGWQVTGHEINTYAVKRAREQGLEILDSKFSVEIFNGRKFAAVILLGVLEHLPHPDQTLQMIRQLILPGGVLASLVPNRDSLATRILRDKSNTFDGIEHLNFWDKDTYGKFVSRHGFKLVHAETAISELYTINNYMHFDNPYTPSEMHPLILPLTPDQINQNYMGHHLCCYSVPV